MAGPWEKYAAAPSQGRVFTLPRSQKDIHQEQRENASDALAAEAARRAAAAERRTSLEWNATHLPDGSPKPKPNPAMNPDGMRAIRQDAVTKINQIRQLRAQIEGMNFPNVTGAGLGDWLKHIPGTSSRGVSNSLGQISAAGALATALQMAKNNGGKNPLTPMSNSDIQMISNITAALDQGQSYTDLKHQLDNAEQAFGHAYVGAGGDPSHLLDRNRNDGPFPGMHHQQQSHVIDFNDLPEH